jgi:hypothetical protein
MELNESGEYVVDYDRVLTLVFRWLPALAFTWVYLMNGELVSFALAVAFTILPTVQSVRVLPGRKTGGENALAA